MSVVWPVTGLYLGPFAIWMYLRALPLLEKNQPPDLQDRLKRFEDAPPTLFQEVVAVFHCGAGCTLGDVSAELLAPLLPLSFGAKLGLDFAFAYLLGIAFQYFTIVPMRKLSFGEGLAAAAKADTISIVLFEVGMFGWMAISYYLVFPSPHLTPQMAVFWFMMQIAMIAGTLTALPANAWLIRKHWKEKMPQADPEQVQPERRAA